MRSRLTPILVLTLWLLPGGSTLAQTAAATSSQSEARPQPPAIGTIELDTVVARKAAVEAELKALAQSNLPKESLEATQARLEQLIKVLTNLENALQKRATYRAQIDAIPQRQQELAEAREAVEAREPRQFAEVTEALRDEYEAKLQAAQTEVQELKKQIAAGEVRLAAIPKELEQLAQQRSELENELRATRSGADGTGGQKPSPEVELLPWRLQLLEANVAALEAEREWLTKSVPLQDTALSVPRARLKILQQELDTIKGKLGTVLRREQRTLQEQAVSLEQQLGQVTSPAEELLLTAGLETVKIRQASADLRQQLNRLGDESIRQEKHNAQLKQEIDRLRTLAEKYSDGEGMAQRLLVTFERLRRERLRQPDAPIEAVEARLQALTEHMFVLDDRLYEFDQRAEERVTAFSEALQGVPSAQREAATATFRQALAEQRAALREQQQVLSSLVQDATRLLALHREYKRLLDEGYFFVLTEMFWLRDAKTLSWGVAEDVVTGALSMVKRLRTFVVATEASASAKLTVALYVWLIASIVFVVLPWSIWRFERRLRLRQEASLAHTAAQDSPPGLGTAVLIVLRAALWPAYLALLAWLLGQFLPQDPDQRELSHALVSGLQISAVVLGAGLLGRYLLQPDGWGQRCWNASAELCRFLRRIIVILCLAVLILQIPRYILLAAPGEGEVAVGSLALARAFFLAFLGVVLVLVSIMGRRGSPLMTGVLARSREREGLLWRLWPIAYLLILASMAGIIALDAMGYRYAARFIWLRALGSLTVVLTIRLLIVVLVLRLLHGLVTYIFSIGGRLRQHYPDVEEAADRYFRVSYRICNVLLSLLAVGIVLELWGISVTWFLTSPLGLQILARTMIILLTIGLTVAVIQVSNAFTDYVIQPRTLAPGRVREPSRKLKTLAPLMQTLIKVGVVFAAVLVLLEQINVATAPLLTGIGIFGLAVGFASQSLIKDVINGLFILFEDSLSVGDVVNLRGTGGVVEKVTLRAVTLRDLAGNVHVIPNSTIDMITNMTKEYSRFVLDVRVALREDVERIIAVLREVDEDMRRDPTTRFDILEPLEILGLDRFEESGMIVRARMKTRPLQQWRLSREFNRRMKKLFDARGIQIPFPHRMLYWGSPSNGDHQDLPTTLETQHISQESS
jgi:small-conductance mechanosensitive channel